VAATTTAGGSWQRHTARGCDGGHHDKGGGTPQQHQLAPLTRAHISCLCAAAVTSVLSSSRPQTATTRQERATPYPPLQTGTPLVVRLCRSSVRRAAPQKHTRPQADPTQQEHKKHSALTRRGSAQQRRRGHGRIAGASTPRQHLHGCRLAARPQAQHTRTLMHVRTQHIDGCVSCMHTTWHTGPRAGGRGWWRPLPHRTGTGVPQTGLVLKTYTTRHTHTQTEGRPTCRGYGTRHRRTAMLSVVEVSQLARRQQR
jgi:hypothetical protein